MQFQDDVAAGVVLVRPAIQSPDYDPGVAGWAVKIDGSAEFNDLTVRGTFLGSEFILNDDGMFFYDGTPAAGNLIMSIAAAQGTDGFGNDFRRGVMVYNSAGSSIQMDAGAGAAVLDFQPPDVSGVTWETGTVAVGTGSRLGTNTPVLSLSSPYNTDTASSASIQLFGNPEGDTGENEVFISTQKVTITGELDCPTTQSRVESVSSVGAVTSFTTAITFDTAYPSGVVPSVTTNINSGSGTFARWMSRAISISNTGFTLFIFRGDAADPAATWTNQSVTWTAHGLS